MSSTTIYILYDSDKYIWGAYNSEILLNSMITTLRQIDSNNKYYVNEFFLNTNICKKKYMDIEFKNNNMIVSSDETKILKTNNKSILREIKKLEDRYDKFEGLKKTFENISSNCEEIPEFMKKDYKIFMQIKAQNIPDDEMFGFYLDNQ